MIIPDKQRILYYSELSDTAVFVIDSKTNTKIGDYHGKISTDISEISDYSRI